MKISGIVLFIGLITNSNIFAQVNYNAEMEYDYNYTEEKILDHKRILNLFEKYQNGEIDYDTLTKDDQEKISEVENFGSDLYQILNGCSWYCGANYKIECSSSLPRTLNYDYACENISNFSLKDAWIENVSDYGKGESITFKFNKSHPRITEIFIANGYVRNSRLYYEHSRVKKMIVFLNGTQLAIINLQDLYALQRVVLNQPIEFTEEINRLKFIIDDVYPGNRYEQTAISEIYFDGLDVH